MNLATSARWARTAARWAGLLALSIPLVLARPAAAEIPCASRAGTAACGCTARHKAAGPALQAPCCCAQIASAPAPSSDLVPSNAPPHADAAPVASVTVLPAVPLVPLSVLRVDGQPRAGPPALVYLLNCSIRR